MATSLCIMRDKPKEHVTKEHLGSDQGFFVLTQVFFFFMFFVP